MFNVICDKSISDKWQLGRDLEGVREPFVWISGRREFQADIIANMKALRTFKA